MTARPEWQVDPVALAGLALLAYLYVRGVRRAWSRGGAGRALSRSRVAAFAAAWVVLVAAVASPWAGLEESLLSVHMAQHMLLVAGALGLVAARAGTGVALGLDAPLRGQVARIAAGSTWLGRGSPLLRRPVALAVFVGVFALWHVPAAYEAALGSAVVHALEHATFLGSAWLFWTSLFPPGRRRAAGYGGSILAMFGASLIGNGFGALLTFSSQPWYPRYVETAPAAGVPWLEDQQLAGLVMWVPMGVLGLGVVITLIWRFLAELEAESAAVVLR